ncbi:MAG: zinc-ribbon domain-containing protein [Nitrosopumilaceae archaeon]|nr:zinc-ribbon domain-containing protein [Nitrosopumilaceae archaeon]
MNVFDGKRAATDYMSTHTLAFSTPELTLVRFAFWLGDTVPDPADKNKTVPRMMTFMTEQDFEPVLVDDDTYVPTGAVKNTNMYGNIKPESFCGECGNKMSESARFCNKCGTARD